MYGLYIFLFVLSFVGIIFASVVRSHRKKIHLKYKHFSKALITFIVVAVISTFGMAVTEPAEAEDKPTTTLVQTEETADETPAESTTLLATVTSEEATETAETTTSIPATSAETTTEADEVAVTTTTRSEVSGNMTVHFIDVGQGDAILIQQGSSTMLIDAGDNHMGSRVVSYIRNQGVSKIDLLIATHPHADHIGGMDDVIYAFDIGRIIMPDVTHTTKTFEDLLLAIQDKGLRITKAEPGNQYALGAASLEILGPIHLRQNHLNNSSVVCRINFGSTSFLFAGDAEQEAETDLIRSGRTLTADVLKVGHHGSSTSTTQSFLDQVSPTHAVILCGEGNRYSHPSQPILDRLSDLNIQVYRTDLSGTIIAVSDGSSIRFNKNPKLGTAGGSTSPPTTQATTTVKETTQATTKPAETTVKETTKETTTAPVQTGGYIGNLNTKKFHYPTCSTLPNPENRIIFDTRQEAIDAGYDPCGRCKP